MIHKQKRTRLAPAWVGILCLGLVIVLGEYELRAQDSSQTATRSASRSRTGRTRRRTNPIQIVSLPTAKTEGLVSFEQTLSEQSDVYEMTAEPLDNMALSQLAWAAQIRTDLTQVLQSGNRRASQAADPRSLIQLHFVTAMGVYRYQPSGHQLEQISNLDQRMNLILATVDPQSAGAVGCGIVIAGPGRGTHARDTLELKRISLLETGRIAQNIRLQATGLQLVTASVDTFDSERVKPLLNLSRGTEALYVLFVGQRRDATAADERAANQTQRAKRVAFVVPPSGFNDTELFECQRLLSMAGVETVVTSIHQGVISGALGGTGESKMALTAIPLQQIDALIYIGGPGIATLAANTPAQKLAQRAQRQGKLIGATSSATTLLAKAGLLKGLRVTADPTEQTALQNAGAVFTNNSIERDGSILTARGPTAMTSFARLVTNALAED